MNATSPIDDLISELGLSGLVEQVCARPGYTATPFLIADQVLYHNSLYGIELFDGESVVGWLKDSVITTGPAGQPSVLVLTTLPDLVTNDYRSATTLFASDWPTMIAILQKTAVLFDIVCIGPVQALCGPVTGRASEVIESLQSFWHPTYSSHQKLPPILLFNGGDALDKQDVHLMRQYAKMLR